VNKICLYLIFIREGSSFFKSILAYGLWGTHPIFFIRNLPRWGATIRVLWKSPMSMKLISCTGKWCSIRLHILNYYWIPNFTHMFVGPRALQQRSLQGHCGLSNRISIQTSTRHIHHQDLPSKRRWQRSSVLSNHSSRELETSHTYWTGYLLLF
jgi:hypothetical protein